MFRDLENTGKYISYSAAIYDDIIADLDLGRRRQIANFEDKWIRMVKLKLKYRFVFYSNFKMLHCRWTGRFTGDNLRGVRIL